MNSAFVERLRMQNGPRMFSKVRPFFSFFAAVALGLLLYGQGVTNSCNAVEG